MAHTVSYFWYSAGTLCTWYYAAISLGSRKYHKIPF